MKIKAVTLLNFGRLVVHDEQKQADRTSATGYLLYPAAVRFTEQTDRLKGEVGLRFGIRYQLNSYEPILQHEDAVWECHILHPMITNPQTLRRFSVTTERKHSYFNQLNFDYYHFEFDWEVRPGTWVFQLVENNRTLLEKPFVIT